MGEEVVALLTRLREMRKRRNLSQKVLAKELNIEQSTYSGYETGKSGIPLRIMVDIAKYYGVTVDDLLVDEDEDETKKIGLIRIR
jgi:transcriptional regulator with XRE-family HTH domain